MLFEWSEVCFTPASKEDADHVARALQGYLTKCLLDYRAEKDDLCSAVSFNVFLQIRNRIRFLYFFRLQLRKRCQEELGESTVLDPDNFSFLGFGETEQAGLA